MQRYRRGKAATCRIRPVEQARATATGIAPDVGRRQPTLRRGTPDPHVMSEADRHALLEASTRWPSSWAASTPAFRPRSCFDQGVGDLFTVRTAGHSLAGVALGSIEFGVRKLGVPLVVVMAHTGCGAVLAALSNDPADGHLGELTGEVADRLASRSLATIRSGPPAPTSTPPSRPCAPAHPDHTRRPRRLRRRTPLRHGIRGRQVIDDAGLLTDAG